MTMGGFAAFYEVSYGDGAAGHRWLLVTERVRDLKLEKIGSCMAWLEGWICRCLDDDQEVF